VARKIAIGLVVVIVVFLVLVATRPATFHIERSLRMEAPASAVAALVDDFHAWRKWSPWEKFDPAMKRSFSGNPRGLGAGYAWEGNDQVGKGRMTIVESTPRRVAIKLEFLEPWTATNTATFSFAPEGDVTTTTWAMDGQNSFMAKAVGLFMDMDKMIGADFERGLSNLKAEAEREP
jgi:hypothetical protein